LDNSLRFAVMGDMHYVQPESHKGAFGGNPRGVTELADLKRNHWMTQHVLPEVISTIAQLKPDFVIQTGDIIHGNCDNETSGLQEMKEALHMLESLKAPLFFAPGNHDGTVGNDGDEALKQFIYPAIGKALGVNDINRGFYTFEKGRSLFIVLEYTAFLKNEVQAEFMREALARSCQYEHTFLFAHPPLIPIARPFFTDFDFVNTVVKEVAQYPIDAYFCGHTHNQIASLHQVGDHWMPQLKSTVLGYPDSTPIPVTDVRPLLAEPSRMEYGWGFLEDSAPGWWIVTVTGEEVQADWHVLRRGVMGQLRWRTGERAVFTQNPEFGTTRSALPQQNRILSVKLRAAGSNCQTFEGYKVSLNGTYIGTLPRLEHFDSRQLMEIESKHWSLLTEVNRIEVSTANEPMAIGGFVLEIETDGACLRSSTSGYSTNTDQWDHWGKLPLVKIKATEVATFELTFHQ
jgi:predicted phosphodiesterase